MNDISKLELRLIKKTEQLHKLKEEVQELEKRVQEEKEAGIVKAIRKVELTNAQYRNLEKGVRNKTVFEFLEKVEKEQLQGANK